MRTDNKCVQPWLTVVPESHSAGKRLPLVGNEQGATQMSAHVSIINPGCAAHEPHRHPGEEIILLLEGTGEFLLGEERHRVTGRCSLFCPEMVMHGLRNVGDVPLVYCVVRTIA